MGSQPLAVPIARGDLAVEIGFTRLAEIQQEILWLCEAAHVHKGERMTTEELERQLAKLFTDLHRDLADSVPAERVTAVGRAHYASLRQGSLNGCPHMGQNRAAAGTAAPHSKHVATDGFSRGSCARSNAGATLGSLTVPGGKSRLSVDSEQSDRAAVVVDVDAHGGRLAAEAGHRLHVATERDQPARAGVADDVTDDERELRRCRAERPVVPK